MSDFYKYFKENMDALGLPCPESLFGNLQTTYGSAATILAVLEKLGKATTVREVIGAGTRMEQLMVVGGISAAYYLGAVIGSIAVATGRTLASETNLGDVLLSAQGRNLNRPWLLPLLQNHPEIYTRKLTDGNFYSARTVLA